MDTTQALHIDQPTDLTVSLRRWFAAPRDLVFRAFTEAELMQQWMLGPGGWTMPVCEIDLRAGGGYRIVWRKDGVPDMGLTGRFLAVEPPERTVATELFDDDWTGGTTTVTTSFEAVGRETVVTTLVEYVSREARDAAFRTGMADGMEAGYRRLDQLLEVGGTDGR
jgi:uncharacterized protein YndB with AHSA1/START domain